jgi:hypothetical protein
MRTDRRSTRPTTQAPRAPGPPGRRRPPERLDPVRPRHHLVRGSDETRADPEWFDVASTQELLEAIETIDLDGPWSSVADAVIPVLRRRRPMPPGSDDLLSRTMPPGIETLFGIDIGPGVAYIGPWAGLTWGVGDDEIVELAVTNVRARASARRRFGLLTESVDGVPVQMFQSRDGWASALLLVPEELDRAFGPGPGLILAPMRDLLVHMPIDTHPGLAGWLLGELSSLDPNGLAVPIVALVDGQLSLAKGTSAPPPCHPH